VVSVVKVYPPTSHLLPPVCRPLPLPPVSTTRRRLDPLWRRVRELDPRVDPSSTTHSLKGAVLTAMSQDDAQAAVQVRSHLQRVLVGHCPTACGSRGGHRASVHARNEPAEEEDDHEEEEEEEDAGFEEEIGKTAQDAGVPRVSSGAPTQRFARLRQLLLACLPLRHCFTLALVGRQSVCLP